MNKLFAVVVVSAVLGLGQAANAQVIYRTYSPVVVGPVVTQYAPFAAPVMTYSPVAPIVAYSPVPTAYAPVTSYLPMATYPPVVTYSPVAPVFGPVFVGRPLYVPGQPVRNAFRAFRY